MKKTILFGNGINYLSDSKVTWPELLDSIKKTNLFDSNEIPNTMTYEKIFLDRKIELSQEIYLKREISNKLQEQGANSIYTRLINLNLDNYLTTNYDYAFVKECEKLENLNIINNNSESTYSIRRHKIIKSDKFETKFWQIHGEISKPISIMLGLDHYCGSVGKIDGYLKGNYSRIKGIKKITKKLIDNNNFDEISWIELFFNSDVHIMALGLDYNETDLWWILNKRARMKRNNKIQNEIYFYTKGIKKSMKELLESFDVNVRNTETRVDYNEYYKIVIDEIANS